MSTIVTRSGKGAALTHVEVDANFTNLNADKAATVDVILATQKGAASGVCPLDATSKVASTYLPSYVDDVLEYANYAGLPVTGETGTIYVALDTNKTYRWSGSAYIYITSGAVDSVAGKTGVVTLTAADVGLGNVTNNAAVANLSGTNTGDQVIPVASSTDPAALGVAAVGVGTTFARADHVHLQPTLATLGAQAAGTYATGTGTASGTNTGDQTTVSGSSGSCTGNAATATKASTLAQHGGAGSEMTFYWNGQAGQPTWLWGGNDGVNHYVYNPSNFNVNYATYAGIRGTAAIGASGTSVTFSGIPAGVKRIVLVCNAIGVTSTIPPVIRIGAGTILTTGYVGSTWYHNTTGISGAAIIVGFDMINTLAAVGLYCGIYILTKYADNHTWMCTGSVGATVGGSGGGVHGQSPNLGAALTQVSIQMPTTAFDGGAFSIYYE